jgi:hypothetical protein
MAMVELSAQLPAQNKQAAKARLMAASL